MDEGFWQVRLDEQRVGDDADVRADAAQLHVQIRAAVFRQALERFRQRYGAKG